MFLDEFFFSHLDESVPNRLFYKTKSGCKFGEKCSYARCQVDEQPTKRSKRMMTKVQWLC